MTYISTRYYRAPELLYGNAYYGSEIDLWAAEYSVPPSVRWEYYWPRLAKWLAEA